MSEQFASEGSRGRFGFLGKRLGLLGWAALVVVVVVPVLWYGVGGIVVHKIDDSVEMETPVEAGASKAVAAAVALIRRETEDHRWTASDPFFMPSAWLDNMPNYQQGIISALARFSIEMQDQIGRARGSSKQDPDLEKAVSDLKFQGDVWVFDFRTSLAPTTTSRAHYVAAAKALESYNRRLVAGEAVFERRADNLQDTIERLASDMGAASADIDAVLNDLGAFSFDVDDLFYRNKGQLYAVYMVLGALGQDFENVLAERELGRVWAEMLASLRAAALMDPLLVINGAPDSVILPSHLAAQGFYLLRARTQLKEISNILLK